jgi:dethiobiotin synthetase
MKYFVTGTGTGVGKTLVSAILTEQLQADYWKPVQSGTAEKTDTEIMQSLVKNDRSAFHAEAYRLKHAISPHAAADLQGIRISPGSIILPDTMNHLVIEGAGGVMTPLNAQELVLDLIAMIGAPVILVSRHYLGSINHTLLTVEALKSRNLSVAGIVFNGAENVPTESLIAQYSGLKVIGRITEESHIDQSVIRKYVAGKYLRI